MGKLWEPTEGVKRSKVKKRSKKRSKGSALDA